MRGPAEQIVVVLTAVFCLLCALQNAPATMAQSVQMPSVSWCESQPIWNAQAVQQCMFINSSWQLDTEMETAKSSVSNFAASRTVRQTKPSDAIYIFIHAPLTHHGVEGLIMLDRVLFAIRNSGLGSIAESTFVMAMGNTTHVSTLLSQYRKTELVQDLSHLGQFYEFPTLALMQWYARNLHPDAKLLFLTTSWANNIKSKLHNYLFDLIFYYNIYQFKRAFRALDAGYQAAGMLLVRSNEPYYLGNAFWSKASMSTAAKNVTDLVWRWAPGAELWPLYLEYGCNAFATNLTIKAINKYRRLSTLPMKISELHFHSSAVNFDCSE